MRQPPRLAAAIRHLHPAMRPRPQPPVLACGRAALAPGAVAASAPHPTTLTAVVTFSYAAACSACRSHSAFSSHHASASPAPGASLRQSRAGPRGCCRVRPHPTTLKADVTFFYAAACSACRRQRWFVLLPCGRVTSSPADASPPSLRAHPQPPCTRPPCCLHDNPHPGNSML